MDTRAIISSLIRPDGTLALPETMTLATLAEMLYAKGDTSALALGFHDVPNDELHTFTRAEVNTRVKAVAARLQQIAEPGTRIASPNVVKMTFGCSAIDTQSSTRPIGSTQTGQPGPWINPISLGSIPSRP